MESVRSLPVKCEAETSIVSRIRLTLVANGYTLVEKTHGNSYQAGWPDLYCFHPVKGHRWVEVKRPRVGRLTRAQRVRFAQWEAAGEGVWVLTSPDDAVRLDGPPNWREAK